MRLRDEHNSASAHVFEVQVELTSLRHNQPLNPENLNIELLLSSENTVVQLNQTPSGLRFSSTMGSSSSKIVRKLPTKARPSWVGATTSELPRVQQESARTALASESRTKGGYNKRKSREQYLNLVQDIEMDSGDPQFLKKLNQLGPVKVDHHKTAFRTASHRSAASLLLCSPPL